MCSLEPRLSIPDFVSHLWRKIGIPFSAGSLHAVSDLVLLTVNLQVEKGDQAVGTGHVTPESNVKKLSSPSRGMT